MLSSLYLTFITSDMQTNRIESELDLFINVFQTTRPAWVSRPAARRMRPHFRLQLRLLHTNRQSPEMRSESNSIIIPVSLCFFIRVA